MNTRLTIRPAFATMMLMGGIALAVTACSSGSVAPTDTEGSAAAGFPVNVELPGVAEPLVIEKEPQRIVALSSDAAIALHELGLTDRIVAMPEVAFNETLNGYADEMGDVPNRIAGDTHPEPEQVLAWEPDLVVVTTRHTGEQDASSRLTATDVPVLSLTNGWSSSEAIIENLELIGAATGTAERSEELAEEIETGIRSVRELASTAKNAPSVAILSNQAGAPFINAGGSLVSELVANGGGTNVADTIGIEQTMPIQPEQLIAADPDFVMLVDVAGRGEASFASLLENPAVAALPAVAEGRVQVFPGRQVYGLAGVEAITGSEAVLGWLHPELAR